LVVSLAAIALGTTVPMAAAATSKAKSCVSGVGTKVKDAATCKGIDYYRSQTITFIVPTTAGAQFDIEARDITPLVASYLRATINILDVPTGGSITGQDLLARSSANGLTIGMFELGTDVSSIIQNLPGLNFNPDHEALLGGPENPDAMLASSPNSPYKNLKELQTLSLTTPARYDAQNSSSATIQTRLLLLALGVKYQLITGFANSVAVVNGFVSGDGNLVQQAITTMAPLVQGGKAIALYVGAALPPSSAYYTLLKGVPDFTQVQRHYELKTALAKRAATLLAGYMAASSIALGGPSRIPADEVSALRAAIKYAMTSGTVSSEFLAQGVPPGFVDGPTEKAGYITDLDNATAIRKLLGY
jgi:tripartite-type tricarboxylate transporter receptor subunit TctC